MHIPDTDIWDADSNNWYPGAIPGTIPGTHKRVLTSEFSQTNSHKRVLTNEPFPRVHKRLILCAEWVIPPLRENSNGGIRNMRPRILLIAVLTAAALLCTGCGNASHTRSRTITDMKGRNVVLNEDVTRVVALTAADCEIIYAVGAGNHPLQVPDP